MKYKSVVANLFLSLLLGIIASAQTNEKQNIDFILMDNLSNGEVGCYGAGITRGTIGKCISTDRKQCSTPPLKIPVPTVNNLYTDPREEKPAADSWVAAPMLKIVWEFEQRIKGFH